MMVHWVSVAVLLMIAAPAYAQPAPPPAAVAPAKAAAGAGPTEPLTADEAELPPAPKVYSYGTSNLSILFMPNQVGAMKDEIRVYEGSDKTAATETVEVALPPQEMEIYNEPESYPVFYLSSIAYNAPNDWSLWIGGYKITSRINKTDLSVIRVTADSATFSWQPTYTDAIDQRFNEKKFASTEIVKNKVAANQQITRNGDNGSITFTLKQNQTFAVGYFSNFEGYVESPTLEPLAVAQVAGSPAVAPVSLVRQPPSSNQRDQMRGQGMPGMPRRMGASAPTPTP